MALEYCELLDLFDYVVTDSKGRMSDEIILNLFKKIITAIGYLHEKGYVHRDMKLDNVILDKGANIKVCDLGLLASHVDKLFENKAGTRQYWGPEIWAEDSSYRGPPADIFACGVIFFMMLTLTPPFGRAQRSCPRYCKLLD
jgi:serine/threonine protein kinase